MSDIIYDKPHRRKNEVHEVGDVSYISGLASSDSIVLENSVYGETFGICHAHLWWLQRTFTANEKHSRALVLELTWSTNEMKIVEEAKLS